MIRVKSIDATPTVTTVTIITDIGEFVGVARFNAEKDPLNPSAVIGGRIAENRAKLKYYKQKIKNKKYELKGLNRLLSSMPLRTKGRSYVVHTCNAIQSEINEYYDICESCKYDIETAIEGRAMYLRSRTMNKENRDKFLNELGESIKKLGKNKNKDKND